MPKSPAQSGDTLPSAEGSRGREVQRLPTSSVILATLVVCLYAALYASTFSRLAGQWYSDPNYSHGFLIPIVSAYLIWDRRASLARLTVTPSARGTLALVPGLLLLVAGTLGAELFLQNVSTVVVLAGLVWLLLGGAFLRALAFPLAFLIFYVPLPAIVHNQVAFPLQLFAAKCAVMTLSGFGVPVLREGNIIELTSTTLEVAEACSGIRSLQSLVALSTIYAYVAQRTATKRLLLVLSAIPIAVVSNASRVSGTGLIADAYGVEMAEGFYHGFAGWLIFVVAMVLLLLTSCVITRLPPRDPARRQENAGGSSGVGGSRP